MVVPDVTGRVGSVVSGTVVDVVLGASEDPGTGIVESGELVAAGVRTVDGEVVSTVVGTGAVGGCDGENTSLPTTGALPAGGIVETRTTVGGAVPSATAVLASPAPQAGMIGTSRMTTNQRGSDADRQPRLRCR